MCSYIETASYLPGQSIFSELSGCFISRYVPWRDHFRPLSNRLDGKFFLNLPPWGKWQLKSENSWYSLKFIGFHFREIQLELSQLQHIIPQGQSNKVQEYCYLYFYLHRNNTVMLLFTLSSVNYMDSCLSPMGIHCSILLCCWVIATFMQPK